MRVIINRRVDRVERLINFGDLENKQVILLDLSWHLYRSYHSYKSLLDDFDEVEYRLLEGEIDKKLS